MRIGIVQSSLITDNDPSKPLNERLRLDAGHYLPDPTASDEKIQKCRRKLKFAQDALRRALKQRHREVELARRLISEGKIVILTRNYEELEGKK